MSSHRDDALPKPRSPHIAEPTRYVARCVKAGQCRWRSGESLVGGGLDALASLCQCRKGESAPACYRKFPLLGTEHTGSRPFKFPSKVKCLQESWAAGGQPGRLRPEAQRSNIYFGATWTRLFVGHPVSSVPISRVRCSKCPGASPAEYVAWGDTNAPEADRREASALLAQLVEKDHPRHNAVYSGMTLEELRQRVGRKASSAGS